MEPTVTSQKLEHEIVISASPEKIWAAFTGDEFWHQFSGPIESDWQRGSVVNYFLPNGSSYASGIVLESESPLLLSHTWPDPDGAQSAEQAQRLTWRMERTSGGSTKLMFAHENMTERAYENVRDSWPDILANLKKAIEMAIGHT
jgi:uncharacterized protein YndB with AHSA1/START domain